jgi:hypothetical protein
MEDRKTAEAEAAKRRLRKGIDRSKAVLMRYRTQLLLLKVKQPRRLGDLQLG